MIADPQPVIWQTSVPGEFSDTTISARPGGDQAFAVFKVAGERLQTAQAKIMDEEPVDLVIGGTGDALHAGQKLGCRVAGNQIGSGSGGGAQIGVQPIRPNQPLADRLLGADAVQFQEIPMGDRL